MRQSGCLKCLGYNSQALNLEAIEHRYCLQSELALRNEHCQRRHAERNSHCLHCKHASMMLCMCSAQVTHPGLDWLRALPDQHQPLHCWVPQPRAACLRLQALLLLRVGAPGPCAAQEVSRGDQSQHQEAPPRVVPGNLQVPAIQLWQALLQAQPSQHDEMGMQLCFRYPLYPL